MRKLHLALLAAALAIVTGAALAQTAAPTAGAGTVKAVQPGLFEAAGPRVNEVVQAGIQSITAAPGKGGRSIHVRSPWSDSFYGWPKNLKPVAFTIEVSKATGIATISAPGFTEATRADYKAAIDAIVPLAIRSTNAAREWKQ